MKELTRNEMAVVKRIAKSTKQLRDKRNKIIAKQQELEAELIGINNQIDLFEQPIKNMTGGFTSEEVLNGIMEVSQAMEPVPMEEISEEAIQEVEVPAEKAVIIDPNVQSPLEPMNPFEESGECGTNINETPFMN